MKRLILACVGIGMLVGLGFYVNRPKPRVAAEAQPTETPSPSSASEEPPGTEPIAPPPEMPPRPAAPPDLPTPVSRPSVASSSLDSSFLNRTVDVLVSPQAAYPEKQAAWKQLREAGKLDQAITELEQRTANDPRNAEYPATLGQAYLQKCGTIQDVREQGILAMQADKMFDAALSLDPANWEARFTKAVAMSYWPPMLNKGDEVIQHFHTLIQQQESQPQQPQFAESYAWLGDQYRRAGRVDDAKAIWQRGLAFFPADEKLRNKLAAPQ